MCLLLQMAKYRIKMQAFDNEILDKCVWEIVNVAQQGGAEISGPIMMPTKHVRFVVNRSPHIDKKSREVFFIHTHARLIDIFVGKNSDVLKSLQSIAIPAGVGLKFTSIA